MRDFPRLVLFLLLAYSGTDTLYVELVYSHRHTEGLVCWYELLYPSPLGVAAVTLLICL